MSGQNNKFIICQILGAVCLYPVSGQSLTTREGFFSISTVFKYSQRLKYTTTNYCSWGINVRGSLGLPVPMNLRPHEHMTK